MGGACPALRRGYARVPVAVRHGQELREVLEEWVALRRRWGLSLPVIEGISLIPIVKPKFIKSRTNENSLLKVPPASRGNRTGAVPLAKRGEPAGGGQFMNFGHAIGITQVV